MASNKLSSGAGRRLANSTSVPFKSLNKEGLEVGQERDAGGKRSSVTGELGPVVSAEEKTGSRKAKEAGKQGIHTGWKSC